MVLRKKNILEKKKNQCVSEHQKEDNSYSRQKTGNAGIIATRDVVLSTAMKP